MEMVNEDFLKESFKKKMRIRILKNLSNAMEKVVQCQTKFDFNFVKN